MADILPGFSYSRSLARYRSDATGRFVSRADIAGLLDIQVQSAERRLAGLITAYHEGNVSPAWFAENMRTELRRAHLQNRALGVGGIDKLTAKDYGAVGRKLRDDYARIADLTRGIADGTVSLPQALNRMNGYAGNARIEFYEGERAALKETGREYEERRVLGNSEHCDDCIEYAAQGFQPLGVLPLVGQASQCTTHCRCSMVRREVKAERKRA